MSTTAKDIIAPTVIGLILLAVGIVSSSISVSNSSINEIRLLKKELIESNMARYNPTTGEFELIKPNERKD